MRFSVTPDGKIYGECSCLTVPRNSFVDCRKIKEKPTEMNPFENQKTIENGGIKRDVEEPKDMFVARRIEMKTRKEKISSEE